MQPVTDEQIYNKFKDKTKDELQNILYRIENFEIQYREKENALQYLKDNKTMNNIKMRELRQSFLRAHAKEKKEMKDEIRDMEITLKDNDEEINQLESELKNEKVIEKRRGMLRTKHIIENYVLTGIPLSDVLQKVEKLVPEKHEIHTSTLFEYPLHEVKTEIQQDEMKLFLTDIDNLYVDNATDEEMLKALDDYSTKGLQKIFDTNKTAITDYEKYMHEKMAMDTRVARKPKEYPVLINIIKKYKDSYSFVKRTQPLIEKVLIMRQRVDIGTNSDLPKVDIEKLKELMLKYPELKEGISNVLLSELIKKGTVDKKDIDEIKRFIPDEKPYTQKTYSWLQPTDEPTITNELKYNVIPFQTFSKTYTYCD